MALYSRWGRGSCVVKVNDHGHGHGQLPRCIRRAPGPVATGASPERDREIERLAGACSVPVVVYL